MALCRFTAPCPPFFQQWKKWWPNGMPPVRVPRHLLPPGFAAQIRVEALLEASLADQVAGDVTVAVAPCQLALAHLADVTEEVRGQRPERIVALRRHLQRDAGQVELVR